MQSWENGEIYENNYMKSWLVIDGWFGVLGKDRVAFFIQTYGDVKVSLGMNVGK